MPLTSKTPSMGDTLVAIQEELVEVRKIMLKSGEQLNKITEFLIALLKMLEEDTQNDDKLEKKDD